MPREAINRVQPGRRPAPMMPAPPIVHRVLQTPGTPLGPIAGPDFSHVRVHTDEQAAASARAINADAYAAGPHIAFDSGKFSPLSPSGRDLLHHELMHVNQQRSAAPAGTLGIAPVNSDLEHQAGRTLGAWTVQRAPAATPPPTSLDKYPEAERTALVSIQDPLPAAADTDINDIFAPPAASGGAKTSYSLGSSTQAVFDPSIPATNQKDLSSVAAYLAGHITPPLDVNQTMSIDITPLSAVYRFSHIQHGKQEVMLIERLGAIPASGGATAISAGKTRFTAKKFSFAASFTDSGEKDKLYEALSAIPDSALVNGLTFARQATGTAGEAGEYDDASNTIRLFDLAFKTSSTRSGLAAEVSRIISHEVGHALDRAPIRAAFSTYQGSSGTAADENKLLGARGLSGLREVKSGGNFTDSDAVKDTSGEFRTAAKKDGAAPDTSATPRTTTSGTTATVKGAPTDYGNTSWEELFAESFSLYVSDPNLLKAIRPNVYAFFAKKFPNP